MQGKCQGCEYLNTTIKQVVGQAYRYGCGLRKEGYISTWINTDRLLEEISCNVPTSEEDEPEKIMKEEVKQITVDEWLKTLS